MNLDSTTMKIYCLDTGLLLTQSMAGDAAADARLLAVSVTTILA